MKLGEDRGEGKRIDEFCRAVVEAKDEKTTVSWNLSSDYDYDHFPEEIARCLEYAQKMERD